MEKQKPVVSIFCIAYNHADYIRECLDGMLAQKTTYSFEIIVHDDASTDGTTEIIKEYRLRFPEIIVPIFQTENQYSKGNRAIIATFMMEHARGEYICICEGDDYWCDPGKLQRQIEILSGHLEYGMCHAKAREYDQARKKMSRYSFGEPVGSTVELMQKNRVPTLTACIRKNLYLRYLEETHPEDKDWKMGDYPLWIWISCNSGIYFENRVTAVYRVLQESASHSLDLVKGIAFARSKFDIVKYFAIKYSVDLNKSYTEFNEKRAMLSIGFENLDRKLIVESGVGLGNLGYRAKIGYLLSRSQYLFWIVVLIKRKFK